MLTTAITAAIVSLLNLFGVSPEPMLIGAIWIAVKALVVATGLAVGGSLLGVTGKMKRWGRDKPQN
ncbi:MAG: hypothetical protein VKP62_16840 [Candidatus Sericytochromatia bacterium]|nr:hypothetical protein [Candidatus Sericytochromatia bacterium]